MTTQKTYAPNLILGENFQTLLKYKSNNWESLYHSYLHNEITFTLL
jgi:hypothetical protein